MLFELTGCFRMVRLIISCYIKGIAPGKGGGIHGETFKSR